MNMFIECLWWWNAYFACSINNSKVLFNLYSSERIKSSVDEFIIFVSPFSNTTTPAIVPILKVPELCQNHEATPGKTHKAFKSFSLGLWGLLNPMVFSRVLLPGNARSDSKTCGCCHTLDITQSCGRCLQKLGSLMSTSTCLTHHIQMPHSLLARHISHCSIFNTDTARPLYPRLMGSNPIRLLMLIRAMLPRAYVPNFTFWWLERLNKQWSSTTTTYRPSSCEV